MVTLLAVMNNLFAPEAHTLMVPEPEGIDRFARIVYAIGMVESGGDATAINHREGAYGKYQIRAIRLKDYHQRTGVKYSVVDMLDEKKAEKVLRYYCNIHKFDRDIALDWNCRSEVYWRKVKLWL